MKKQPTTFRSSVLPRFLRSTGIAGLLPALVLLLSIQSSHAGSATWLATPATGDWNTATNWTPATVPNGPADTATFASSNQTGPSITSNTEVNGIVFNAGASAFTINATPTRTLTISGVGITNNSGITQNFVAETTSTGRFSLVGTISFTNSATAGSLTAFTNNASTSSGAHGGNILFVNSATAGSGTFVNKGASSSGAYGGNIAFDDSATAGSGTFVNNGGLFEGRGGIIAFDTNATAGNGTFTNNGAAGGTFNGQILFRETATAGNGTFTNNPGSGESMPGGFTVFEDTSTAGNATLIANGGLFGAGGAILFSTSSTGGMARLEVFGTGYLDISGHNAPGVTTGSIQGNGAVFLGANNLTVGSNNLNTTFSGVTEDHNSTGGSLTKIGRGTLTLSNASTYTGGTTVSNGTLLVTNTSASATGTSAVRVNAGTLGGTGIIAGAVTVGTRNGAGAFLAPGTSATFPGTLTIQNKLNLQVDAIYQFGLNSSNATADETVANGVKISSGAQFSFTDHGSGVLTPGTVFTVINNTATTPIAGTFSNLADGSTFTSGSNTYQVSYEGGDGNDLTLTVQ